MTDDLIERMTRAISADARTRKHPGNWAKHAAYAARGVLQPGDVLPNGWVAPDRLSRDMMEAYHDYEGEYSCRGHETWLAMRATAIREREG